MIDAINETESAWREWPIDREIVISRVIKAPRDNVFSAWTDPSQIQEWFGPKSWTIDTREIDLRSGGVWRFDMIAPDGSRHGNRMVFLRMESPTLLEVEHGLDQDDGPGRFRMLVTFDEQNNGKTVVTLRQMHPSKAQRDKTIGFGAAEYGEQTLEKLARHAAGRAHDRET